jgi:hypothetical protein
MILYEKVMIGKRVSYRAHVPPPLNLPDDMTEGQIVSAVGGLAILTIHGYQTLLPEHKRISKKVQKVKDAVLDMYQGTGQHIDQEIIDHVCAAWDGTMRKLAGD